MIVKRYIRITDFYPRPPRGGRPEVNEHRPHSSQISIHALREEGDAGRAGAARPHIHFYPRPPRGGRRARHGSKRRWKKFLSTPSARRATARCTVEVTVYRLFLSTPSARRATSSRYFSREGSVYFYPRPPRGGRPTKIPGSGRAKTFLSTPSARRATAGLRRQSGRLPISIHALREEGDPSSPSMQRRHRYFYPRPPRGGRQQKQRQNLYFQTNYTTFCTNLEEP